MLLFICFTASAQTADRDESYLQIDSKTNCYIRYHYFPNLEAYFDNLELVYLFKIKGEWQIADELPPNYGGYSMYNNVRVSITDYDGDEPYELLGIHKKMYPYNAKGRFANQTASAANE